jgi:hypothetical protein
MAEYKPGQVDPEGRIWTIKGEPVRSGKIWTNMTEALKAEKFGWRIIQRGTQDLVVVEK